jgi:hypothetical protein
MTQTDGQPVVLDTTVANSARLYNFLLGGKDNFAVDRAAAAKLLKLVPEFKASALATRAFLTRAVRTLTEQLGIRQFLDIGTGLPTANNTHEIAQAIAPESRILYVDNDPMVLAHARALLTSTPQGRADYLLADLRDVQAILDAAGRTLRWDEPVGVVLVSVLSYLTDDDEAYGLIRQLVGALPAGSHLVISHPTFEVNPVGFATAIDIWNTRGCTPICARDPHAIADFFDGLELLDPGVVPCSQWRPDPDTDQSPDLDYCGVARKP